MKEVKPINILKAKNREELRLWLENNYETQKECWVIVKRGKPQNDDTFWYIDAVEEALCFGWIDSTVKKLDNGITIQRLSPRKKGSIWSELNKERCRRMEKLGKMTQAGKKVLPDMSEKGFNIDIDILEALKKDGYDFTVGIDIDTPIANAERVVSVGKGIGEKKNMKLIEELAKQAGAAIGSSRPVAESLQYLPINRYVGMSGQKFNGNLYIACGISGAGQHLKGIKDATTIVAINKNANAPIFKNADYGIVGDLMEILPLLSKALDTGEKKPAPPMKKMKRPFMKKEAPSYMRHVCSGCGYEYDQMLGDVENDIAAGTSFEKLPEEWVCPECGEDKTQFIETLD